MTAGTGQQNYKPRVGYIVQSHFQQIAYKKRWEIFTNMGQQYNGSSTHLFYTFSAFPDEEWVFKTGKK